VAILAKTRSPTGREVDPLSGRFCQKPRLVRRGDEHDPTEGFRFVSQNQATYRSHYVPVAGSLLRRLLCVGEARSIAGGQQPPHPFETSQLGP
jgi:hypothetical protein